MEWSSAAIILSVKSLFENSFLVTVLSQNNGLYKGMFSTKKNRGILQTGNIVSAHWKSRLSNSLGYMKIDLNCSISAFVMNDKIKLFGLKSLLSTLNSILPEREENKNIYTETLNFLYSLKYENNFFLKQYVYAELITLEELGFGIKFTFPNDFISPKTGKTVDIITAGKYKDKLFKFPTIFNFDDKEKHTHIDLKDFMQGFKILQYFLDKRFFSPYDKKIPIFRKMFFNTISKHS